MPKTMPKTYMTFSEYLQKVMDEQSLDIRGLAEKTESTYEHIRKMLRGASFPSKYFMRTLADVLKLDSKEVERLLVADRIRHKYGSIPAEISGKNPDLEPVEKLWPKLTPEQHEILISQMETLAKRNRAEGR